MKLQTPPSLLNFTCGAGIPYASPLGVSGTSSISVTLSPNLLLKVFLLYNLYIILHPWCGWEFWVLQESSPLHLKKKKDKLFASDLCFWYAGSIMFCYWAYGWEYSWLKFTFANISQKQKDMPQNIDIGCGEVVRLWVFSFELVFIFPFFCDYHFHNLKYVIKKQHIIKIFAF